MASADLRLFALDAARSFAELAAHSLGIPLVCAREVVIADRQTTVLEAAQLMRQFHVGSLVVVDSMDGPRRPIGIVTDRDIAIEVVAKQMDPGGIRPGEMLVGTLATVTVNEGVFETLRCMREHGIRRMPVVDANGRPERMIS
jgi:CBS domain-containing protein